MSPHVEIYTQPWCGYCSRAKQILDGKGVEYREIDAPLARRSGRNLYAAPAGVRRCRRYS